MTVSNQTSKNVYVGNGATVLFAYTFRIFADSDLEITIQDTSVDPQTEITLVLNTDYTVTGADSPTGGDVTLLLTGQLSAAPSATDNITIRRNLPIIQPTDYVENDPFPANSHEKELDRGRMIDQQIQEEVDRSLKLSVNITGVDVSLPTPEADAPIGWNSTATGLTNNPANTNLSQIDTAATPDFIGAAAGDGVLRASGLLSYTDGGDFVTIGITNAAIDHDALTNYVALQHFPAIDEDDLISDSDTEVPTQQSVKAYVDAQITSQNEYTELTDTPAGFGGDTIKFLRVNAGETAVEHITLTGSLVPIVDGGGIITATEVEGALQENRTAIDLNTAKVTNANHTGDVTGDTALTLESVAITGQSTATVASLDELVIADVDDSDNLKVVTAQSIADLAAGGGAVEILDEGGSLTAAVTSIDFVGAGVLATTSGSDVTVTIAGCGGGATLDEAINQTTHGFSVGEVLYHNGTIYALADASAAATAESIGIVSAVADGDNFTIQFGGKITGLSGLTIGEAHFLSETPGAITATAPTTVGAVIKPILIADSATTAFIFNMRGESIVGSSASAYVEAFVNPVTTISVVHNLGTQFVVVTVWDENDTVVLPDDITATSTTTTTIDLTSFGSITGTWNVRIVA